MSLKIIRKAVDYFSQHTISKRIQPSVTITLQVVPDLFKIKRNWGDCLPIDNGDFHPREFRIRIDPTQSVNNILRSIAHEIVHVAQYSSGKLKDYQRANKVRYDNWVYDFGEVDQDGEGTEESDKDYWLSGWEIEAMGYEEGLYQLFARYHMKKVKDK